MININSMRLPDCSEIFKSPIFTHNSPKTTVIRLIIWPTIKLARFRISTINLVNSLIQIEEKSLFVNEINLLEKVFIESRLKEAELLNAIMNQRRKDE
jgi:hypothetical protein